MARTRADAIAEKDRVLDEKSKLEVELQAAKRRAASGGGFAHPDWMAAHEYKIATLKRRANALQEEAGMLGKAERIAAAKEHRGKRDSFLECFRRIAWQTLPEDTYKALVEQADMACTAEHSGKGNADGGKG